MFFNTVLHFQCSILIPPTQFWIWFYITYQTNQNLLYKKQGQVIKFCYWIYQLRELNKTKLQKKQKTCLRDAIVLTNRVFGVAHVEIVENKILNRRKIDLWVDYELISCFLLLGCFVQCLGKFCSVASVSLHEDQIIRIWISLCAYASITVHHCNVINRKVQELITVFAKDTA